MITSTPYVAFILFQDSQNDTFLLQAGVYLLVRRDLWLEILCFSYGTLTSLSDIFLTTMNAGDWFFFVFLHLGMRRISFFWEYVVPIDHKL